MSAAGRDSLLGREPSWEPTQATIYGRSWMSTATEQLNLSLQASVTAAEVLNHRYRSYADAVVRGQENERLRLARELHDDTIHRLILLGQKLELARLDLDPVPDNPTLTRSSNSPTPPSTTCDGSSRTSGQPSSTNSVSSPPCKQRPPERRRPLRPTQHARTSRTGRWTIPDPQCVQRRNHRTSRNSSTRFGQRSASTQTIASVTPVAVGVEAGLTGTLT